MFFHTKKINQSPLCFVFVSRRASMDTSSEHVTRILYALANGNFSGTDAFSRSLERLSEPSTTQMELIQSLQILKSARKEMSDALDLCEQSGFSALAVLCRKIMQNPTCEFALVNRWGVCAVTGHTVNRLLSVTTDDVDILIDSKFSLFAKSLWNVFHFEMIEILRAEQGECSDISSVCAKTLALSYVASFAQVKSTLNLTVEKLHDLSHAAE